ncbi:MAG: hypothetical protein OEL87_02310 [Nanoarchaeota archaeon]|nr:hypothetical protein [Nanoarchaeota archaeon]
MRIIAILIVLSHFAGGCAVSSSAESKCSFSTNTFDCGNFLSCEEIFTKLEIKDKEIIDISTLISMRDFLILLESIESGKRCAQRLGFRIFGVSLDSSLAGYMEELSTSLSYSIEKNPAAFLQELPNNFLKHADILASLSCGIREEYWEDSEYTKTQLQKRLIQIDNVKNTDLISKKEIIKNSIQNYLNNYYQD